MSELAARFGVHPTMIASWKRALLEGAPDIFDKEKVQKQTRSMWTNSTSRSAGYRWNAIFVQKAQL